MKNAKKAVAAASAGLVLAATGGLPALAAPRADSPSGSFETSAPVGSVFSGIVEATSEDGFLVERKQRQGSTTTLVTVDIDAGTVASREGLAVPLGSVALGASVIVSGTKGRDGSVLATKIILRKS